jgi:hypothetical protein
VINDQAALGQGGLEVVDDGCASVADEMDGGKLVRETQGGCVVLHPRTSTDVPEDEHPGAGHAERAFDLGTQLWFKNFLCNRTANWVAQTGSLVNKLLINTVRYALLSPLNYFLFFLFECRRRGLIAQGKCISSCGIYAYRTMNQNCNIVKP